MSKPIFLQGPPFDVCRLTLQDQLWQEMRRAEKPKACAASAAAKSRAVKRKAQPKAKAGAGVGKESGMLRIP